MPSASSVLYTIVVLVAHVLSLYGWGGTAVLWLHGRIVGRRVYAIAMGIAVWILLCGILSALRMIGWWSLGSVLVIGWVLAAIVIRQDLTCADDTTTGANRIEGIVLACVASAVSILLVLALCPTTQFNYHDDFIYYLTRAVRILATGKIGGDPFDYLGFDSAGAQSCLHCFFLLWLSPDYLNILDPILCFVLAACLLAELGGWLGVGWQYRILSALLFMSLNPQYVNLSSLYSGSLMILGVVAGLTAAMESIDSKGESQCLRGFIGPGLFLGALVPLKSTFGPWVALVGLCLPAIVMAAGRNPVVARRATGIVWLTALLSTLVWMVQCPPTWFDRSSVADTLSRIQWPAGSSSFILALAHSPGKESQYGGRYYHYGCVILLGLAAVVIASAGLLTKSNSFCRRNSAILAGVIGTAILGCVLLDWVIDDTRAAKLRYACPLLIVILALSALLGGAWVEAAEQGDSLPTRIRRAVRAAFWWGFLLVLAPSTGARTGRMWTLRTLHPFNYDTYYRQRGAELLGEQGRKEARFVQELTERCSTVLVRTGAPFQYDFARNRIFVVTPMGLIRGRARLPLGESPEALRQRLLHWGIHYVIWEYAGHFAVGYHELDYWTGTSSPTFRELGRAGLAFYSALGKIAERSYVIYESPTIVAFDITRPP